MENTEALVTDFHRRTSGRLMNLMTSDEYSAYEGAILRAYGRTVIGSEREVARALAESRVSRSINTPFVERQNGTDRHRNARKVRKTYRFSKDWRHHEAATYFSLFSYNFCWPVRTLRVRDASGDWASRTPAMAAGLADHVWSIAEWIKYPIMQ